MCPAHWCASGTQRTYARVSLVMNANDFQYSNCDPYGADSFGVHESRGMSGGPPAAVSMWTNGAMSEDEEEDAADNEQQRQEEREARENDDSDDEGNNVGQFFGRSNRCSSRCWGCEYGDPSADEVSSSRLNQLMRLFSENFGRISMTELSKVIHEYHENEIRQPMLAAGKKCKKWTPSSIKRHFSTHALEPVVIAGKDVECLERISRMLRKHVMLKNQTTGESKPDRSSIELLLKVQKQKADLLKNNPKTMLFYDGNYKIDEATTSAMVCVHKRIRHD